jgi:acyl-CoA reductase-like NAD-dependent aldehyde dehydrogenase
MSVTVYDNQYINGEWVKSTNAGKYVDVIDSNTATVCAKVPDGSAEDMNKAIAAAKAAFIPWSETPLATRKELVGKVLANWQKKKPAAIEMFQKELGCTSKFAKRVQANMVDLHLGVALDQIDSVVFESRTKQGAVVVKEPIGVVGCITPWNYPLNQIAAKIGPAMLVGCTVVLKPSEVTPMVAYALAEAIHEAGLPKGVFNMVLGTGPVVGEVLSGHKDVDMIHFTGSTRAGKDITKTAAGTLKVVRTELGGKSAALMLDDADLKALIPEFMGQLMNNSGQSCNALSRMLVPKERYEEAVSIAKQVAESTIPGRSSDPKASIGPVVSQAQWDKVQGYLKKGIEEGARVVAGGPGKPAGLDDGYYVKPTVFADVNNKMTIAQEEIFGPVLSLIPYSGEKEGIEIANDTIYGLNNAVASANPERALAVARKLRSGTVMINGTAGPADAPFGGYKQSGNAREWGKAGIEEYLVTKHLAGKPITKIDSSLEDITKQSKL